MYHRQLKTKIFNVLYEETDERRNMLMRWLASIPTFSLWQCYCQKPTAEINYPDHQQDSQCASASLTSGIHAWIIFITNFKFISDNITRSKYISLQYVPLYTIMHIKVVCIFKYTARRKTIYLYPKLVYYGNFSRSWRRIFIILSPLKSLYELKFVKWILRIFLTRGSFDFLLLLFLQFHVGLLISV